jgi:glycosyltransferase involved in cell wall biosynthesis
VDDAAMRICLFTPTFLPSIGGAERDADVLVRGLIARGHDVFVLAPRARLKASTVTLPYPVRRYIRPPGQNLWPEALAWPVYRAHNAWRFDAMLAFYGYPTGYAASLLKRRLGFALVTTPRGADLYPNYHALRRARVATVIRAGYRGADRIVSISNWLTQRLHEVAGPDLPPVDLVPNGLDVAEHDRALAAARSNPPALPINRPFILHLARVAPVKQQTLAVRAVARLRKAFETRGLQYAIVGDGNGADEVRRLIDELDVGHLVKMLGTRDGAEKAWLYGHASLMVSTSREEGFGNVVIEAMASGLPMLASDIAPHRELIGERGWGVLFRSGDVDDLTAKLGALLDADTAALRRAALDARDRFTLDAMIRGYEASLQRAMQERER